MAYWVKRIILKTGELITEKELGPDENHSTGDAPFVGDEIMVSCRGRTFKAKVIWGNWKHTEGKRDPNAIIPLRVEEI